MYDDRAGGSFRPQPDSPAPVSKPMSPFAVSVLVYGHVVSRPLVQLAAGVSAKKSWLACLAGGGQFMIMCYARGGFPRENLPELSSLHSSAMSGALRARLFEAVALGVFMANMLGRKGEERPPVAAATAKLRVGQLHPAPRHLRREGSDSELELLADSLRLHGQLTPLWVRPLGDDKYEIIAGVRRWRAAQLAGLETLSCQVFAADEDQAFVLSLVENLQRQQLTPLEEAQAYQELLDRGIVRNRAGIARLAGVHRSRITRIMKLLELDPGTQQRMKEHPEILNDTHGRLLWEISELTERHRLADEIIAFRRPASWLKTVIEERRRAHDIARWQAQGEEYPRSFVGRYAGFSFQVDLMQADWRQAGETMISAGMRLLKLAENKEQAIAGG